MKLCYRGVTYDYNPPVVTTQHTQASGKYRGLDWRFRKTEKAFVQQPSLELKYRGVAYGSKAEPTAPVREAIATAETVEPVKATTPSIDLVARDRMINSNLAIKKRQQAMLNRLAGEVGFHEDVSGYWNRIQGKVHPTFRATYGRSTSTLS